MQRAMGQVAEIASRQWGVVARWQLLRLGIATATISDWLSRGYLHRIHPGVYAVGHAVLSAEARLAAALFYAGPGSALSHTTRLWWTGLVSTDPGILHVSIPGRRRSVPGIAVHERRRFDRVWHRRLPVTTLGQALLDSATVLSAAEMRRRLSEADFQGLLDVGEIRTVAGRRRRGSARLLHALDQYLPELAHTRSELERAFLEVCQGFGVAIPEVNVFIEGFLVDAVWREKRVVVELDGRSAHSSPAQMERDRRRDLALRAAGYVVLRYSWRMVTREPERVAADLIRTLTARMPS
jgi:hypothetical protein